MLAWLYYVLLLLTLVTGWGLNIFGLPGLWVMLLGHIAFAWASGWGHYTGWPAVTALFVLAVAAEAIEFVAGAAGSKKAGGTKRGMAGAIVGGFAGGIAGSILIPVPVLGTIAGAIGGTAIGAGVTEKMVHPDSIRALRIAYGAAKGRLLGLIIKSGIGLVMGLVSVVTAFPIGPPPPAIPTTGPATLPASMLPSSRPAATAP